MKHYLTISTLLTSLVLIRSPLWAQTQSEANIAATEEQEKADAKLNSTYKLVLFQHANEKQFCRDLQEAQRAWLKFMDFHMKTVFPLKPGENVRDMYGRRYAEDFATEQTTLISQRTKQLEGLTDTPPAAELAPIPMPRLAPSPTETPRPDPTPEGRSTAGGALKLTPSLPDGPDSDVLEQGLRQFVLRNPTFNKMASTGGMTDMYRLGVVTNQVVAAKISNEYKRSVGGETIFVYDFDANIKNIYGAVKTTVSVGFVKRGVKWYLNPVP